MSEFKAFISCSLRQEDNQFVRFIENYLKANDFLPFGTVGRHDASPENPVKLMRKNIHESDFVVICATKRYIRKDVHFQTESNGISEMIQFESGLAHANEKPILVFVEDGVNVGAAIPNITQYITIKRKGNRLSFSRKTATRLIERIRVLCDNNRSKEAVTFVGMLGVVGLAIYGAAKLVTGRI
ncbi:MAG: hypothetical protein ACFHU9_01830 [Fluviicola sp.]